MRPLPIKTLCWKSNPQQDLCLYLIDLSAQASCRAAGRCTLVLQFSAECRPPAPA